MDKKYFWVMAMDGASVFHPTGSFNHKYFGVAEVTDEAEYDRLKARGCRELTKDQFDEEYKKKAGMQQSLDDFRPIVEVHRVQPAGTKPTAPDQKAVDIETVKRPAAVPIKKQ